MGCLSLRRRSIWTLALALGLTWLAGPGMGTASAERPLVESYLHAGKLTEGEAAALAHLKEHPEDAQARFGLGVLQLVRAIERFSQANYKYGLRSERGQRMGMPFLSLPLRENVFPETFTYPAARKILEELLADLKQVEAALAAVKDPDVRLPLQIGMVKWDQEGDGDPERTFNVVLDRYLHRPRFLTNPETEVVFDAGDVAWLRGEIHSICALAEIALGYNGQELFDATAHLFFNKVETPHRFLKESERKQDSILFPWKDSIEFLFPVGDDINILDVIALVHLISMPVEDADRLKSALAHLEQMCVLHHESWRLILAEEDDDHEWRTNPRQKAILGEVVQKDAEIQRQMKYLEDLEAMLAGKLLLPFWRGKEPVGG